VNCPQRGALMPKLICEPCAKAKSDRAYAAQQKQYAEVVATDRAPLLLIEMFARGTNNGTKWHIQRLGGDPRHALCGAFFRTMGGLRPARLSRIGEFKPLCDECSKALQEIVGAAQQPTSAAS
jgi:hypothetical protein